MGFIGSKLIKAKDAIGEARELVGVEEARISLASIGRTFYNMAVAEIHNLLLYIDTESLTKFIQLDLDGLTEKYLALDMSEVDGFAGYDKITALEILNGIADPPEPEPEEEPEEPSLIGLQSFILPIKEFLRHKSYMANATYTGAKHPYQESVIYTITDNILHILWGEAIIIQEPAGLLYFIRQPEILTIENYDTANIDVPDKYYSVLVNRIAAYAELRQGITDKAVAMSQQSFNQMMTPLEPQLRAKLMDSFQLKSTFTPNETSNNRIFDGR